MTRARCVQMDAVHAAAVLLLLTAMACAGCSMAPVPASAPPPAASDTASRTPLARVATLRVGLPARGRSSLLFNCDTVSVPPRIGAAPYEPDSSDQSRQRWLR